MNKKDLKIGIDFDNTIIDYQHVFHKIAVDKGLINKNFPKSKLEIRDYLRSKNMDYEFTLLQGEAYGPKIILANEYNGLIEVLKLLKIKKIDTVIVSHKTRYPYKGPKYDLRKYALEWLESKGFFSEKGFKNYDQRL